MITPWYVACNDQQAGRRLRLRLERSGIEVRTRWLDSPRLGVVTNGQQPAVALTCYEDMDACIGGILLPGVRGPGHGARHAEAGYLMGQGKPVIVHGELEHTLYHSTKAVRAPSEAELLQSIRVLTAVLGKAHEIQTAIANHDAQEGDILAAVRQVMEQWEAHVAAEEDGCPIAPELLAEPALETLREIRRQLEPITVT